MNRIAFGLLLVTGACAPDETDPCLARVASASQAITLSEAGTAHAMGPWQDDVLRLRVMDAQGDSAAECTASRIAEGVALTARHCFTELGAARVSFAADGSCLRGATVRLHPSADVALVLFDDFEARPGLCMSTRAPSVGSDVVLTGYGLTEHNTAGQLRAIAGRVRAIEADMLRVQGADGGACVGDSGGPLLAEHADEARLLGTLSRGSASCLAQDEYVSVAALRSWLDGEVAGLCWRD